MGRTISSITQTWLAEKAALERYKRALRKSDQELLKELLVLSRLHLAEASFASNIYPMDAFLISMVIEIYKQLKSLQSNTIPQEVTVSSPSELITLLDQLLEEENLQTGNLPVKFKDDQDPDEPEYVPFEE
ncbi:MAG: hypothetical protein HPY59_04630 [Anaerolineae bacterium]|nr:hypothetical protein [Anaerolineae bacterium]